MILFAIMRKKTSLADILDDHYSDRIRPSFRNNIDNIFLHDEKPTAADLWKNYLHLSNSEMDVEKERRIKNV